jgi:hypothetical protein
MSNSDVGFIKRHYLAYIARQALAGRRTLSKEQYAAIYPLACPHCGSLEYEAHPSGYAELIGYSGGEGYDINRGKWKHVCTVCGGCATHTYGEYGPGGSSMKKHSGKASSPYLTPEENERFPPHRFD